MLPRVIRSSILRCFGALGYEIVRLPTSHVGTLGRIRSIWSKEHPAARSVKEHLYNATIPDWLPSLGNRWGFYAARLRSRVRAMSSLDEIILLGQAGVAGVETHLNPFDLIPICETTDLMLRVDLPDDLYSAFSSFRSPRVVHPDSVVEYRGRKLDFVSLCAANSILRLLRLLDQRPRNVCDIGGGTGKYAFSWLTNSAHRPDLVVIIDLPETLIYSESLLRSELGDDRVQYITSPDMIPNRSGAVLCPIANVRTLEGIPFDLATNTESMQEMTDAWVDWYMDWLDRQTCRYFWSSNYFASSLVNMHEGHNSWSPRPGPNWRLIHAHIALGARRRAEMLFQNDGDGKGEPIKLMTRGVEAWLARLERARVSRDEVSLRDAVSFAQSEMPFIPKEAWQVAKMLAKLTDSPHDKAQFEALDYKRRAGTESLHHH
jgi:hypothetical protein